MFTRTKQRLDTKAKRVAAGGIAALLMVMTAAGVDAATSEARAQLMYTTSPTQVGTGGQPLSHATLAGTIYVYVSSPSIQQIRYYFDDATGTSTALTATSNPFVLNDDGSVCGATAPAPATAAPTTGAAVAPVPSTGRATTSDDATDSEEETASDESSDESSAGDADSEESTDSTETAQTEDGEEIEFRRTAAVTALTEEEMAEEEMADAGTGNAAVPVVPITVPAASATATPAAVPASPAAPTAGTNGALVGIDTSCLTPGVHVVLAEITSTNGTVVDLFARFLVDPSAGGATAAPVTGTAAPASGAVNAPVANTATAPRATTPAASTTTGAAGSAADDDSETAAGDEPAASSAADHPHVPGMAH